MLVLLIVRPLLLPKYTLPSSPGLINNGEQECKLLTYKSLIQSLLVLPLVTTGSDQLKLDPPPVVPVTTNPLESNPKFIKGVPPPTFKILRLPPINVLPLIVV